MTSAVKKLLNYQYINNIEKKVQQKLEDLSLNPELPLSKFIKRKRRFYAVPCRTKEHQRVFFKIVLVKGEKTKRLFKREIKANLFMQRKRSIAVPSIISAETKKTPYWFTREYVYGFPTGYFYDISKAAQKKEVAEKIAGNLFALQNISIPFSRKINSSEILEERKFQNYHKIIKRRESLVSAKDKKDIDIKAVYNLLEELKKKYADQVDLVFCHGDYTLANFLLSSEKVYVTDWEHLRLDNFCVDLAHLWIETWKFPKWRKALLNHFASKIPARKQEMFKEIFRIVVISNALGGLAFGIHLCPKADVEGARKSAKAAIKAALIGFDPLLSL